VNSHELHEIPVPVDIRGDDYDARLNTHVVVPKDSSLGFVYITLHDLQLWVSNFINGAHVEWVPLRAVRLNNFLPLRDASRTLAMWTAQRAQVRIIGYDEDENVVYLWTKVGVFGLQLDRMQSHKLLDNCGWMQTVYPYKSFFTLHQVITFSSMPYILFSDIFSLFITNAFQFAVQTKCFMYYRHGVLIVSSYSILLFVTDRIQL